MRAKKEYTKQYKKTEHTKYKKTQKQEKYKHKRNILTFC